MTQPEKSDELKIPVGTGDILGIVHLLSLATDVAGFRNWLVTQRNVEATAQVFKGYMFGIRTLVRLLHGAIDLDFSLDLTEDFTFTRAGFYGVPIAEVPNSCEKAILLRNINHASRQLLGAKSWVQVEHRARDFSEAILTPLQRLSSVSKLTLPKATPDYETAVNFASQWHMHLFLHDTRRGYPHGYQQPMLHDRRVDEMGGRAFEKEFEGYKLTVQYLWFRLLGVEFVHSVAADIHRATNWQEFDEYYGPIQHELIDPKEKLTKLYRGFNTLMSTSTGAKRVVSELLVPKVKDQPLSMEKEIQRRFLWYDVELVDASSTIFNGVLTFISLLNGAVVFRQRANNPDAVLVMRVKHPEGGGPNRFDFSYGLLIEGRGSFGITDYSGWLLFYDCCGNYSGFAGSQHAIAEKEIQEHLKQKAIELHEATIDKRELLKLMQSKLLSTTKDVMREAVQTKSNLRTAESKLGAARGLLLELLGMRHYYRTPSTPVQIEWAYERLGQGDIDLVVRASNLITFVECKKPEINDPVEQVNKLKKKVDALFGSEAFKKEWRVTPHTRTEFVFAIWERPTPDVFRKLRRTGADVIILSSEAEKAGIGQKAREHLKIALHLDVEKSKPKLTRDKFLGPFSF
jgi:hypothetical protein